MLFAKESVRQGEHPTESRQDLCKKHHSKARPDDELVRVERDTRVQRNHKVLSKMFGWQEISILKKMVTRN